MNFPIIILKSPMGAHSIQQTSNYNLTLLFFHIFDK